MTVEQAAEVIELLHTLVWIATTLAAATCITGGLLLWRIVVLAKNQRHVW